MKLNNLVKTNYPKTRVGRGIGSGKGKTSGRGVKGQKSRSGVAIKSFEGGQMPLQRRVPKFGFRSPNRIETRPINLDTLQKLCDSSKAKSITPDLLVKNGLAQNSDLIKILGRGELTAKVNVSSHYFSASAIKAIKKLRENNFLINEVLAIVDRNEGGYEALKEENVQLKSLFSIKDFIK